MLLNFRHATALEPQRQALPAGQSEASWTSWLWNVRIDGSRLLVEWNNLEPEVTRALACLPVPHLVERVTIDAEPATRNADADSSFTMEILLALAVAIVFAFLWTASDPAGTERAERVARLARGAAILQKQGATAVEWTDGLTWSGCGRGGGGLHFTAVRNGQRASVIFCQMRTQRCVVWDDDHR